MIHHEGTKARKAERIGKKRLFDPSSFVPSRLRGRILLLSALFVSFVVFPAVAAEPFFKKGDVIALVGGEDMVAASEYGYLELLLTRALPDYHLKFRCLAWEGDTVFEQRRDLNFPSWEEQLEKIGATVVICQFGQMESMGKEQKPTIEGEEYQPTKEQVAEITLAYAKLLDRLSNGEKRRLTILGPYSFAFPQMVPDSERNLAVPEMYLRFQNGGVFRVREAIQALARRRGVPFIDLTAWTGGEPMDQRDGVHLSESGRSRAAAMIAERIPGVDLFPHDWITYLRQEVVVASPLRQLIVAKNRLWFDYWRPQNWAFLAGDRTEQPSSRDHLDRTKRWFPEERERFLPLIEKKEQEIWDLAAKLAKP